MYDVFIWSDPFKSYPVRNGRTMIDNLPIKYRPRVPRGAFWHLVLGSSVRVCLCVGGALVVLRAAGGGLAGWGQDERKNTPGEEISLHG